MDDAEIPGVFATHTILSAIPEWQVGKLLDSEEHSNCLWILL